MTQIEVGALVALVDGIHIAQGERIVGALRQRDLERAPDAARKAETLAFIRAAARQAMLAIRRSKRKRQRVDVGKINDRLESIVAMADRVLAGIEVVS